MFIYDDVFVSQGSAKLQAKFILRDTMGPTVGSLYMNHVIKNCILHIYVHAKTKAQISCAAKRAFVFATYTIIFVVAFSPIDIILFLYRMLSY